MAIRTVPIVGLVLVAVFAQTWLIPKLKMFGLLNPPLPVLNSDNCKPVTSLVACEDQWIHRASGLSYLPCSSLEARVHWLPAVGHLNATYAEQSIPSDEVKLYDLNTGSVSTISISNRPPHLNKLHLHAIDAVPDPKDSEKFHFFVNNHGTPRGGTAEALASGADSTIEIFEGRLGGKTWTWVKSVKHPLVVTPNNLVAVAPRQFYVTNDHPTKTGPRRQLALYALPGGASGVIYCDASGETPACKSVADGISHPNGITKGPGRTLYVASTASGTITSFEIQADHDLTEGEQVVKLPSPIDNIHVDENGSIIVATIPAALAFMARSKTGQGDVVSTVWKVSNETSDDRFYGKHYKQSLLFSDPTGKVIPCSTNAQLYKGKLYITGVSTPHLVVCESPSLKQA